MLFVFSFLSSLALVILTVPFIIKLAFKKQLFQAYGDRVKVHRGNVPHLGGVAIYLAVFIPLIYFSIQNNEVEWLMFASLLVFGIGLIDEVQRVSPGVKFIFQCAAACLIAVNGHICIMNLQGILRIETLAYQPQIFLTLVFIVGIVNAFNLIDGIDGLAGSIALFVCVVYSYIFYQAGMEHMCYLSCSTAGALLGFLFFNLFADRKIFLGDCGSLLIGLLVAFYTIKFLGMPNVFEISNSFRPGSKFGFVAALLSIPVFDTLRVFVLRVSSRRSPFQPDNNHIHHRLLLVGLSHIQATLLLVSVNLCLTGIALKIGWLGDINLILIVMLIMILFNSVLTACVYKYKRKQRKCYDLPPA